MIARIFHLFIFILITSFSYGQSLFEFDYFFDIDGDREHYKSFMVRNDDGTGFMRVRFYDSTVKSWILVDMEIQEHYFGDENPNDADKTDSSILVFEGFNPQVILGPRDYQYDPDIFLFQYNDQSQNYEPAGVISVDDQNKEWEGTIRDVGLLNEADLTKQKMSQYFTQQEDVYVNLFEEANTRSLSPQERQTQLFLIIVANTEDISIGTTCAVDKDATYKTFNTLAQFLGIKFVPKVIFGKDFSKANVDRAINEVRPAANDIVIFYYSGHGFSNINDRYRFPHLDLRDNIAQKYGPAYALNMEDIYSRIKQKGARMNLVFSDCCNSDPSLSNVATADAATTRHSSVGWNMENCKALFMNEKPVSILMTAAAKGELSAGNSTGGIFTFNFRESMEKSFGPFSNFVTWDNLLKAAQKQTVNKANNTLCIQEDNSRKRCVQNPIFKVE